MFSFANRASVSGASRDLAALLKTGASAVALCAFAAATPVYAQTGPATGDGTAGSTAGTGEAGGDGIAQTTEAPAPTGGENAIVITGIRQSLANSQNIKRNSDTVVDAITAQDIGALPDRSVTEALQRVPGVNMNRFAGSNDPDHFSVEGSGVVVRGLNFVRSEFNGRDTFSAGVYGQAINFADVPAELLGSVEVYKNATAEMIEGGLAGTVNLNTRLPFDNKGFHVSFDAEAGFGDMRKKWSPTGSLLISDTWDTGIGRIGLLADISYSQLLSRADGLQVTNFQTRDNTYATASNTVNTQVCRNPLPSDSDTQGFPTNLPATPNGPCTSPGAAGSNGFADPADLRYAPLGGQFRSESYNRERTGIAAAAQWESLDRRALLTAQFLRTDSTNRWGEHTFESAPDLSEYNTYPVGCRENGNGPNGTARAECPIGGFTNYQYDSNNVFESGYITLPGTGWRSQDSGGTWRTPTGGMQQSLSRRQVDEENIVTDYGLNFKFTPDDHWQFNVDGDYTKAQHDTLDVSVFGSTFADNELDISGDLPQLTPHKPVWLSATWSGAQAPGGGACPVAGQCSPYGPLNEATDSTYFSDPRFTFWRAAMDHIEHSVGEEWAFKGDLAYKFDEGSFLRQIKFGARYADRDETVRYTTYNWGRLSETWSGTGPVWMDQTPASRIEQFSFNNFFRGQTNQPPTANYYSGNLIQGYHDASEFFKGVEVQGGAPAGAWLPLAERAGVIAGTPYLPNELQQVSQANKDAYVQLNFGNDDPIFGNVRLSGNIGVRYVNTRVKSTGAILITAQSLGVDQPYDVRCANRPPPPQVPPGTVIAQPGGICLIGPDAYAELQNFASATPTFDTIKTSNDQWLPSLNLKFGLTDDLIMRFAASKVMTLPDLASIRNSFSSNFDANSGTVTFNVGNPRLKPATATQFDITAEWYFARVGSLTVDAFYKEIKNFFFANTIQRSFTQNGITADITVRGPDNYSGKGKIKGVEVAYQQTFDFLPGFLSGLGMNASYTYLKSSGLPNSFLNGGVPSRTPLGTGNLPLEQLSKHTINLQGFYEKGPISLRAAWNWRSKFLLTASDVIFPYYPIFNDAEGSLDASAFFNITKQLKVGVQGVNLTNTVTKTLQQFSPDGLLGPRSYYMRDRRFSFIVRGNF